MWKVGEFGQIIGVSTSTLRRWEKEGRKYKSKVKKIVDGEGGEDSDIFSPSSPPSPPTGA
jgi:hypothetical protein